MRTTQYLTPERLKHLDSYTYSSVDKSFISAYILQPYWRWVVGFMPPWLAPNLITAIGFAGILLSVLTVAIWVPGLVDGPRGVYLFCSLGLFFYQTMDAIDGKQARATGSSSPLGEVVDHGFDTLNCPLSGLIQAAALGLGHSKYTLLAVLVGSWSMWFSTWEEYHTGTLYLGYINGPTEGILIAVAILAISGVYGPGFWAQTVEETLGHIPLIPKGAQLLDLMMAFVAVAFLCAHLPFCLINVRKSIVSRQTRALTGRGVTPKLQEAYLQNAPIVIFTGLCTIWVVSPYSVMLSGQHMIEFAFLVCFLFGQLSSKVIVAQLTKGPFPYSPALLIPLLVPAIGVNLPALGLPALFPHSMELLYLHALVLLSFVSYLTSATLVVNGFCSHLGISAFTIPYERVKVETRRRSDTSAREEGVRRVARLN